MAHLGSGTVHHCPKQSKGNCRGRRVICTKHQVVCTTHAWPHLKTEHCIRCFAVCIKHGGLYPVGGVCAECQGNVAENGAKVLVRKALRG